MKLLSAASGPQLLLDTESLLDVGSCLVDGIDIAPGKPVPDDGDPRIHRALQGFMFTCGPDHIRHPEPVAGRADGSAYPLHGSFSSTPARLLSWSGGAGCEIARATSVSDAMLADGNSARLERQWETEASSGRISLSDRITNTGNSPFPLFMMYHINLSGHRLHADARLEGAMLEGGALPWRFGDSERGFLCVEAAKEGNDLATVSLGPFAGSRHLHLSFRTSELPFLQIWRTGKPPFNIIALEPATHRLARRSELEASGELRILAPGETGDFRLEFLIS